MQRVMELLQLEKVILMMSILDCNFGKSLLSFGRLLYKFMLFTTGFTIDSYIMNSNDFFTNSDGKQRRVPIQQNDF